MMSLRIKIRLAFTILLLIIPGCAGSYKETNIDAALTDGTHVAGLLLAVEDDWLVLDLSPKAAESQITLLDYGMIDTLRIIGEARSENRGYGAIIGGGLGIAVGIFAADGWTFDSSKIASKSTGTIVIGALAGMIVGGAIGYLAGGAFHDSDIVVPQPQPEDYEIIRQYAIYPDTIPPDLQAAIDSSESWEER